MIKLIGLFGIAAFVAASVVVGVRILMLAYRTRGLPETILGTQLVFGGGLGAAFAILPRLVPGVSETATYWFHQSSATLNQIGFVMVGYFVWRVFRPNEAWARGLVALCTLGLTVGLAGELASRSIGDTVMGSVTGGGDWVWLSLATRFTLYGWAAFESFRYWGVMRRRQVLGLAEQATVDRFFYWGLSNVAIEGIWVGMALRRVVDIESAAASWLEIVTAVLAFVVAWTLWKAFFPRQRSLSKPTAAAGDLEVVS